MRESPLRIGRSTALSQASRRSGEAHSHAPPLRWARELACEPQDAEKTKLKSRLASRILPAAQTAFESPSVPEGDRASRGKEHLPSALMNIDHGQVFRRGLMKTAVILSLHQVIPRDGWPSSR